MKSETKITFGIFFICAVLAVLGIFLRKTDLGNSIVSPFSKAPGVLSFFSKKQEPKKIIYGYLPFWSVEKVDNLDINKLTDIAYFGLSIDEKGNFMESNEDGDLGNFDTWKNSPELKKFIKKCNKNNVRFALTIISHNDEVSNKFLNCRSCWNTLAQNIIRELKDKGIKNLNINFEYVGFTENGEPDKFVQFVKFINDEVKSEWNDSFVVVATFADSIIKPRITSKLHELGQAADAVFVMAYDFHRPSSDTAGPVAPIGGIGVHSEYDIKTMISDYLANIPPNKIIMGVPYYGYNWLVEEDRNYATRVEGDDKKGYSQPQIYNDIMKTIEEIKPQVKWDEEAKTPYFSYVSPETGYLRMVYFENVDSLREKYRLIKENDFAGVGIWALGYDGSRPELWELLYEEFIK